MKLLLWNHIIYLFFGLMLWVGFRHWHLCHIPRRRGLPVCSTDITHPMRSRAKPVWVRQELLQLAARDPKAGCRLLAHIFNRRHIGDGVHVGKTFVSNLLRNQQYEVMRLRRNLRKRCYQPGRRNQVWGIDGTGKTDESGATHFLFGILDHGTRRCLSLRALRDKASITLLRTLLDAIECHGTPKAIRTDNEAIFQSRLFRFSLAVLGVRHQSIELHCPWQNGRIERFFGTLKSKFNDWVVPNRLALNTSLDSFVLWYNHIRPHQHLQGRIPAEVWSGVDVYRRVPKRRLWFQAWNGLLQGEYLQF